MACPSDGALKGLVNGSLDQAGGQIKPLPDIAGLGVLIAFVTSAYLTLFLVIVHYGSGCDPQASSNPIDVGIVRVTIKWPLFRSIYSSKLDWKKLLDKAILMFSDQQLVTGLAILISGFSQLSSSAGGITSYHWQLMVYTAWFASLTHLTTLTIIRRYFREIKKARLWRLCLMTLMMLMLVVALLPTGNVIWQNDGLPARCFFRLIGNGYFYRSKDPTFVGMIISILVLSISHFTRAIKVSERASARSQCWLKEMPLRHIEAAARRSFDKPKRSTVRYLALSTVFALLLAVLDVFSSLLWEIMWLTYALIWGTLHLIGTRLGFSHHTHPPSNDDVFSFGQCIAVILLILPGLSFVESYYELKQESAKTANHSVVFQITRRAISESNNTTFRKRRMIRMGARFREDDVVRATSRSQPSATTQTMTDLQGMENEAGDTTGYSGGSSEHASSDPRKAASRRTNIASSESLYRFEWFRLLALMIFFLVSFWISIVMTFSIGGDIISELYHGAAAPAVGIQAACITLWASTCVLGVFFQPNMWSLVERTPRPNQEGWQIAFRILWYLWYFTLLAFGAISSFTLPISINSN